MHIDIVSLIFFWFFFLLIQINVVVGNVVKLFVTHRETSVTRRGVAR